MSATAAKEATSAAQQRKEADTVVAPTLCAAFADLQYSVHRAPNSVKRDVSSVFPAQSIGAATHLLLIAVFQRAAVPLLEFGAKQAAEKDRLLARFFRWHDALAAALAAVQPGAWIDATDPMTGTARHGPDAGAYSDIDGMARVLTVPTQDAGGCRILKHPTWGFAVYPTTVFTTASEDAVKKALAAMQAPLNSEEDRRS